MGRTQEGAKKQSEEKQPASPTRGRRVLKKEKPPVIQRSKQTVHTYRVGPDGVIFCAEFLNQHGNGGFDYPVTSLIRQGELTKYPSLGPEGFDAGCRRIPLKRISHDEDGPEPQNPQSKYGKTAIACCPNRSKFTNLDVSVEKAWRDLCVNIYCKEKKQNPKEVFTDWDEAIHSKTKHPFPALDKVFTDFSVGAIATEFFLPEYNMTREQKYKFLKESGQDGDVFTPHSNGEYSFYAVENFGYPERAV